MNTTRVLGILMVGILAQALATYPADGQSPDPMQACRAETDDARRLACYDRVIDSQAARAAPNAATPTPVTPEEKFGYGEIRDREVREAEAKDPERLTELVATVSEVSRRPNGTHVITLDNGQVWVEQSLDRFFRVKVGETVRIRPAALGTFLLSTPSKHSTRVKRSE